MPKKFFSEPIFVPKIIDKSVIKSEIQYSTVLVDAHMVAFRSPMYEEIKVKVPKIIIDPVTYLIQYEESRKKTSFQLLPYAQVNDVQKLYSNPTYRLDSFIKPVLDFQIDNASGLVISPYLFSDDANGIIFSTNLTLLGETITNLQSRGDTRPLFAPICIGSSILADNKMVNFIIDRYTDKSIFEHISGYFILVNNLDDRLASQDILLGLAQLVYQLSRKKEVIVNHLGCFGEILNIIGSSAFVSSPGGGETFSTKQLQVASKNIRGRDHKQYIYIPELFNYVNEDEIIQKKIKYQCDCPACTHVLDLDNKSSERKIHFLYKRLESENSLKGKTREEKTSIMLGKLEAGHALAESYVAKGSDLDVIHIRRWINVLEASKNWNYEEDDEELDNLLASLG